MERLKNKVLHFGRYGVASSTIGVVLKANYETWGAFGLISGRFKLYGTGGREVSFHMPYSDGDILLVEYCIRNKIIYIISRI